MSPDQMAAMILLSIPVACFLFVIAAVFRPVDRAWNFLFPRYYVDPETDEVYRLVVYWGDDKHSSVVATIENLSSHFQFQMGDQFYRLKRVKFPPIPELPRHPLPRKHNFTIISGGKKRFL